MSQTAKASGIGKTPEEVDAAQPSDEQILQHLESQADGAKEAQDDLDVPSRAALWEVIQDQRELIDQQQAKIETLEERMDRLEADLDEAEFQADTVEDVVEDLQAGRIGGESGRDFVIQMCEVPDHTSVIDARATQLFGKIIEEHRVDTPVTSSEVVNWFDLADSSNPSVKAKRIMERVKQNREDGFYLGSVELKKHRGKNCIWLGNTD